MRKAKDSTYAIEIIHYGYNVNIDLLLEVNKKIVGNVLSQMMKEFNHIIDKEHPILTNPKITWRFNKELFNQRFGQSTCLYKRVDDPLRK